MGLRGKETGLEAISNSICTLVLLNETRSRLCGRTSSQVQNTRVVSACKRKMGLDKNFFNSLGGLSYYSIPVFAPDACLHLSRPLAFALGLAC
jgi:hypothetical protein